MAYRLKDFVGLQLLQSSLALMMPVACCRLRNASCSFDNSEDRVVGASSLGLLFRLFAFLGCKGGLVFVGSLEGAGPNKHTSSYATFPF